MIKCDVRFFAENPTAPLVTLVILKESVYSIHDSQIPSE